MRRGRRRAAGVFVAMETGSSVEKHRSGRSSVPAMHSEGVLRRLSLWVQGRMGGSSVESGPQSRPQRAVLVLLVAIRRGVSFVVEPSRADIWPRG